jgi:MarR family transcriptional regulator, lower aerobic nicotinate degradation pathway regulator
MSLRSPETGRALRVSSRLGGRSRLRKTMKINGGGSLSPPKQRRPRKDYVLEDQVGFQLRLAVQRHTAIFVANMILTQTQFATIVKLNDVGPCSQNHLARLVALDAATINGVLDRLRKRGYISAEPDLRDARQRVITITAVGRRVVERAVTNAKKVTEETLAPLSIAERLKLTRLLAKIS